MDEKQAFHGAIVRGDKKRYSFTLKSIVLGLLLFLVVSRFPWQLSWHSHQCHAGELRYTGEHVSWKVCGDLNGRDLECSEITVPMDQFNPENSGNKTFTIPLIRLRGKNATQNVVLNPGGPGGSGLEFVYRRGEQLNAIIGEDFHLLSFDPRGVNGSRPQATCYPDQEARHSLSAVRSKKIIEDSPELYAWSQNHVRACEDTMGEHGRYINTPQTAADMNSILDAVGQQDMIYWGFSYGTLLGQTYATLFPERSERVIIDGVVNSFDWYEGQFDVESLADTENVLSGFFDECIKAGKNCTLSKHGKSKEELSEKILALADKLDEPLSVYLNNSRYGAIDRGNILYEAIFPTLYKPANWYDLADRLSKLLDGNATEFFLAYGQGDPWADLREPNVFVDLNDGLAGSKYYPQDRKSMLDKMLPFLNQSLFTPAFYDGLYLKQKWSIPKTHSFVQKVGVKTANPLLILTTTFDPVCPLISARSANAAFEGSQIVEVKGYGHCSVSVPSSCLAKHVRTFLHDGTVPANYTRCEGDGPIFVKPEEGGKAVALKHFDDPEDQRVHLAQVEMAKDPMWPRW